uniref:NADH-ubiquinone oxidoreductase chain 5 n=1 Tax=Euwallacea fornicatus TaxID=995702 RepID=A0A8A2F212_9CUCU|nr:NADH dehydrogenase subunit 5 [Euwallacea fornicatus]QSV10221.1 NADH dehydrogenase subunit 5 [Euwallacea fornicatus]
MFYCSVFSSMFMILSVSMFILSMIFTYLDMIFFFEVNFIYLISVNFDLVFYMDWMTCLFMSFVLYISSMIFNYSKEYMDGDLYMKRFIFLMVMFVLSMMMMIISLNLVAILVGWDGLGLVSYALVIYYQNVKSFNAGMLTALSNRIGDAAILVGIAMMGSSIGSWNFMFYILGDSGMGEVSLLLVLAAITKSAQIPFSSWLPAAMAAPTPVSSLVHSSTLVTAGVYLLIRLNDVLSATVLNFLLYSSLFTMFMAGLSANFEFDLKKIIALSTLSQLGLMISILCLGGSELAFFHLLTHALFKALLFMCAGAIIHNLGDTQDIRCMGGQINFLPFTCMMMSVSNLALCGLPFMAGFYSKDLIAEFLSMSIYGWVVYIIFYLSIGLTAAYSLRLSYFIFFGDYNVFSLSMLSEKNNLSMNLSMGGLIFFVISMGSIFSWLFLKNPFFIFLPVSMKLMTLVMILLGGVLGFESTVLNYYYASFKSYYSIFFVVGMWNLPILSTLGVTKPFLFLGKDFYKNSDHGWLEYYGKTGLSKMLLWASLNIQIFSINHIKIYMSLFLFFLSMIFLII